MGTLQKLIELVRTDPPNLGQAIATLLNSNQHNLGQISEVLYSLLMAGEYKVAHVLAGMLYSQGYQTHAISLSQILAATVLEEVELQRDWVECAQSNYACIWPDQRIRWGMPWRRYTGTSHMPNGASAGAPYGPSRPF